MDDVLCTELELAGGIYTGRMNGRYCWGKEKLSRAYDWCAKNSFMLKDAWYYGDAVEDRHILSAVGFPNCVCPDKKLLKLAAKKKWKVLMWR
jgi:phosphoserine phosphatase